MHKERTKMQYVRKQKLNVKNYPKEVSFDGVTKENIKELNRIVYEFLIIHTEY